jgi:hypothetical protein
MSVEEVVPQLAANMNAAFKKVWKIVSATNSGDVDLILTRIVELAKDGVYIISKLFSRCSETCPLVPRRRLSSAARPRPPR